MPQVAQQPPETRPYTKALRLTFDYEGSNVKLVSTQRVDMILPPACLSKPERNNPASGSP